MRFITSVLLLILMIILALMLEDLNKLSSSSTNTIFLRIFSTPPPTFTIVAFKTESQFVDLILGAINKRGGWLKHDVLEDKISTNITFTKSSTDNGSELSYVLSKPKRAMSYSSLTAPAHTRCMLIKTARDLASHLTNRQLCAHLLKSVVGGNWCDRRAEKSSKRKRL